ncbi:class I SAM-dependent methyltransferase [Novosphingobium sp. Gsoil 351]|uniref:class I SAM-dependent methyltransferase n=1 Tax=Novosphingobium sp. Gsoil 351 TaxID=2675225 RepID=UPI0012B4C856|nr:class I SAM-dependent methyltransferase [Novosphingobium sp. Gsoil 351]QGN55861.1 methyltransferase domain-containing protein [Novosphingobium sp. Gsoil 351]
MFQTPHAMLPSMNHDEAARADFCASLRKKFTTDLFPGTRTLYSKALLPAFEAKHGRKPKNAKEAAQLLQSSFYYRGMNAVGRAAQELVWDTVGESVERQLPELVERAKPKPGALGTVRSNPDLPIPRYIDAVDIHVMPGNFHTELGEDDVFAGALYDRGVHVFAFGGLGDQNEALGVAMAAWVRENYPDFKPHRILDVGCGPGFTTVPWKQAFPDAEVHGIDVGGPQVRYAHGRAESLGVGVHFSQQDGTATDFPDGHFDLVTSMLVTHECPVPVIKGLFKEAHRLLARGGITLHDGGTPAHDPFESHMTSWFGNNANEPFSAQFRMLDYKAALVEAGFAEESYFRGEREPVYLKGQLPPITLVGAVKD